MNTFQEQMDFFKSKWPELKAAMERGGVEAGIEHILAYSDPLERRVLFVFARQGMNGRPEAFEGGLAQPSLDWLVAMGDAGIAELLAQAEAESDPEVRKQRTNSANVISYNLGADLADCWPNDSLPRTEAHHRRGVKAGDDCIRWRIELEKPPAAHSMAYWVRGIHRLALGELEAARQDWVEALRQAELDAQANGQPTELSPEAGFSILLGQGNLGLVEALLGQPGGRERFERALAIFREQQAGDDEERAEDAEWGIAQLEVLYNKRLRPHTEQPEA